jgi:hypothetical protein
VGTSEPHQHGQRIVRPTLRCLFDDLGHEVGPEMLRRSLGDAHDEMAASATFLFPCALTDAEHAVLDKANLIASDEAADRERIVALTDRHVIKVKTGDQRGALWHDGDTWWLLAAGRRKDDGAGDFYRRLERFSDDTSRLAPTEEDERYRRFEEAYLAECTADREAQGQILEALLAAASSPGMSVKVSVFGAAVSVKIEHDEGGLAVLELSWEFLRFDDQDRFPMDILAMVPGWESIDVWEYLPPRRDTDSPHTWFTYVPSDWVDHLATAAEIDGLVADVPGWSPPNPSSDGSEHFSHYASGKGVTLAYVTGIEIVGVCGARVVAHRDYERFPVCPACAQGLAVLREVGRGSDGA